MNLKYNIALLILYCFSLWSCKQTSDSKSTDSLACNEGDPTNYLIAFYNVENLFDTQRDTTINDIEFTPDSPKKWNTEKYQKKLNNISFVLRQLAKENRVESLAILGLAEVENCKVLTDLTLNKNIKDCGYKIVHHDSPDPRGIEVALLYNPQLFEVTNSRVYQLIPPQHSYYNTRDILLVSGKMAEEDLQIIVNHWPSRRSENDLEYRLFAAKIVKGITDSIQKNDPKSKIILMGDLNDNPDDTSCRVILNAKRKKEEVNKDGFYNPMWEIYKSGQGTTFYQGYWDLFDQIIVSEKFISETNKLRFYKAGIFNDNFLFQKKGKYKGSPLRTFSGNNFLNGYSDHLPSFIILNTRN